MNHHHHRNGSTSRTRSRRPSTATINNSINNNIMIKQHNDTPPTSAATAAVALTPLVPGPYLPPPLLRHLINPNLNIHPEDEPDHILAITFAILLAASNRAMSVKELGEAAYVQGYLRTSPSAAGQAIGTHIRNHTARHADSPSNALLSSYKLVGGQEDIRLASALYCSTPGTCRKGTTVWYLSPATGVPCPFDTLTSGPQPLPPSLPSSLKRKIPPDDTAEFQRPNKIRITLRLPPRTPIPPRPRPIIRERAGEGLDLSCSEDSDSDSEQDSDSENNDNASSDSDENMLDDFSSLLATDPITIRRTGGLASTSFHETTLSHPFFDTCEPPPDSEDEDDDFHNSMLRPDGGENNGNNGSNYGNDTSLALLKVEEEDFTRDLMVDFDIKEEDLAAIVLQHHPDHEHDHVPDQSQSQGQAGAGADAMIERVLKIEQGLFSPISALGPESDLETSVSSPTPYPPYTRRGSSILSVPPPTPWIKPEEENFMFEGHEHGEHEREYEYEYGEHGAAHGGGLQDDHDHDLLSSVVDADSAIPIMSSSPSSSVVIRPCPTWEEPSFTDDHHWTSVSVPGPESVSTDDVDFFPDVDIDIDTSTSTNDNRIKPSSSAPVFPLHQGRKPLRLSIGTTAHTSSAGQGHTRRHSHAAVLTGNHRDRRLSIISNTATAFSDWTSGTPEDPDAPLVTPLHTGWRTYQCWPVAANNTNNGNGSANGSPERIEEREGGEGVELDEKELPTAVEPLPVVDRLERAVGDSEEELNRALMAPSFNQVLTKSLPPNHRISTLLLLGIPVFQCRLDSPPMELIRRIDTDYVNISSIISYAKYLSQAAPTSRSRSHPSTKPITPPQPSLDELPPNHVFIPSGARVIHGGWVPLSTARALVKNYHDLPPFIRRVFLSDTLAEKFPPPISYVRTLLVACREREKAENAAAVAAGGTAAATVIPPFGKPFAKPSSLHARELLVSSVPAGSSAVGGSGGSSVAPGTIISDVKGPVSIPSSAVNGTTTRGVPLSLNTNSAGFLSPSYPLSPVAALSSANAMRAKAAATAQHSVTNSMQSLMALTSSPISSSLNPWSVVGFGKSQSLSLVERNEPPLKPEEEEMLNAILKTPPKGKTGGKGRGALEEDEGMSVDEKEEEEVAREVVDIGSEEEEEEERADDTVKLGRTPAKKVVPTLPPRRSLRRERSISSISSELTVSESESSAPPPSLDSRPAPKGKSTNNQQPTAPTTVNGRRRRGNTTAATASVPLPARSEPDTAKRVKIIQVDEPVDIGKPRRSIRTAKSDPAPAAPAPSRASKASQAVSEAKSSGGDKVVASTAKSRRSTVVEKEVEKDGPVLTRAGAAAAQKNAKRTLRSRA